MDSAIAINEFFIKEAPAQSLVYAARQPIFDTQKNVFAYELLYRNTEPELFHFDIAKWTNQKKAFLPFIEGQLFCLMNSEQCIIEVLEHIVFSAKAMDTLYSLKASGFCLALDNYAGRPIPSELLSLIDIIKLNFQETSQEQRTRFVPALKESGKILLAQRIETKKELDEAVSLGFQYFQGSYFSRPALLKRDNIDISTASYLELCRELSYPTISFDRISWIISRDSYLTDKLLQRMRPLEYYGGNTINSIRRALIIMGDDEVRRWMILILMRGAINSPSNELIRLALTRGFLCEKLALASNHPRYCPESFCTGMFSVFRYQSLVPGEAFKDLQLPPRIKDALSGTNNILKQFLDITLNYERGQLLPIPQLLAAITDRENASLLSKLYFDSISAADEMLQKETE